MSGGHGLPHADDHGHYPEEHLLHDIHNRAYKLKPHEKASLKDIEKTLKSGKHLSHDELHHLQHFLEHFIHHMKHILHDEKSGHVDNVGLERELRTAAQLLNEVNALMEHHH